MPAYTVLLVDGQADSRRMLRAALDSFGPELEVLEVPSAEEALLVCTRRPIDLMVTEIHLAGMSGLDLLRKLKPYRPKMKVILTAGGARGGMSSQEAAEAGADACLFKPFEAAGLRSALERCMDLPQTDSGPCEAGEDAPGKASLPARLESLRRRLQAGLVLLAGERGEVIERSGSLQPDIDEASLIAASVAALQASREVWHSVGMDSPKYQRYQQDLLVVSGVGIEVAIFRAGQSGAFFVAIGPSLKGEITDEIRGEIADLPVEEPADPPATPGPANLKLQKPDGLPAFLANRQAGGMRQEAGSDAAVSDAAVSEQTDSELDDVFQHAARNPLDAAEADDYWNSLADGCDGGGAGDSAALSYEDAHRMGLAPKA